MDTTVGTDVTVVQQAYAAFDRGDIPGVLTLLDPQVRWTEAAGSAYAGTFVGHDELVQRLFLRLGEDWTTFRSVPEEYADLGGRVLALGWYEGTHRGTGRSMRGRFAHVFAVDGGRITAFEAINDTAAVLAAMS
jgi:ketosteroid isomerase-like protein